MRSEDVQWELSSAELSSLEDGSAGKMLVSQLLELEFGSPEAM